MNKNYIKLNESKQFKVKTLKPNTFMVKEQIDISNLIITIEYIADKFGHAISDIKTNYFIERDKKEVFNFLGYIEYKKYLLKRIQNDLLIKELVEYDAENKSR